MVKNRYLLILFVLSTSFFIYQHSVNLSWDFAAYVSNAEYWLGNSNYYEPYRPPLMPLALGILSFFGWTAAEYLFILLCSALFLYSSTKLAESLKINPILFYLFSLSPFALFHGLINGTELLSLSLLELFIILLLKNKNYSGLFLGLAALTRYNFLIFLPLILLSRDIRGVCKNMLSFILPFIPWGIYNFYAYGNFLASFADIYAIGFKFREYLPNALNWLNFLNVISFLLPLFIIGLFRRKNFTDDKKVTWIMGIILFLTIYQFYTTPYKVVRYLFPLVLPVAYFSVQGAGLIRKKSKKVFIFILASLIILNVIYLTIASTHTINTSKEEYMDSIAILKEKGISECRILSNGWVILNYLGKTSEVYPRKELIQKTIDEGNFIILFRSIEDPAWTKNKALIASFSKIYESDRFFILGKLENCNQELKVDKLYVEETKEEVELIYNYTINTNPCFTIFENKELLEKICNFINYGKFKVDENRNNG